MADPTAYDELQDERLDSLESLISAEYEPPAGAQYSYPVASQGITQDQWQQMNLTVGDGVVITDGSEFPFEMVGHDSDSETNQRNTLILKVSRNTKRNEASLAGFYFRQTEDLELPFPPVTSNTTYRVTVTYDPRKFKTEPLRVEVWAGEPPRAQGQKHILLKTVERRPNQLLSQATITTYRPHVAPTIVAREKDTLPNATDVLYGTLGITRSRTAGSTVIPGTGSIYEARGIHGWHNLFVGEWYDIPVRNGYTTSTSDKPRCRHTPFGVQFTGRIIGVNGNNNQRFAVLEGDLARFVPNYNFRTPIWMSDSPQVTYVAIESDGSMRVRGNNPPSYFQLDGLFMPLSRSGI